MAVTTSTVKLDPTKSNQVRESTFQRVTPAGRPVVGVLEIRDARKAGCKITTRRYAVCELDPGRQVDDLRGRRFHLTKPQSTRKDGQDHEYTCYIIPARPQEDKCGCVASLKGGRCSHVEALRAHGEAGNLPRTDAPVPAKREPTPIPDAKYNFPNSPTCNPAVVKEYWKLAKVGERVPVTNTHKADRRSWKDPDCRSVPVGSRKRPGAGKVPKCDSCPGDGSVYTCHSLKCPLHGRRNRDMVGAR